MEHSVSADVRSGIARCCRIAISLWLAFFAIALQPAFAEGERLVASELRIAGDASRSRIVIRLDGEPDIDWHLLRGPHRLVIDLPEAEFTFTRKQLAPRGLVSNLRFGQLEEGRARIIVSANGPFKVEAVKVMANEDGVGHRLVADIVSASEREFDLALSEQSITTGATVSAPKSGRLVPEKQSARRPFTIVIDPGHGGIDGGAEGVSGTVEKDVTLGFGHELKKALEAAGQYEVVLTRDDDRFLRLDERIRIAREREADLLISIHADTIRLPKIRGATVYTLSEKASDDEAAALAARENIVDRLAGVAVKDEDHRVADILLDLIRRETHSFSIRFARTLIGELADHVELINNPHRFAGFKVLSAPDVPSVLLELGYLSNPNDEAQLIDPEWRRKAVSGVTAAVRGYAEAKAAQGG